MPIRVTSDAGHAKATVSGWLEIGGDPAVTWASSAIELQDVDPGLLDRAEDMIAADGSRRREVVGLYLGLVSLGSELGWTLDAYTEDGGMFALEPPREPAP